MENFRLFPTPSSGENSQPPPPLQLCWGKTSWIWCFIIWWAQTNLREFGVHLPCLCISHHLSFQKWKSFLVGAYIHIIIYICTVHTQKLLKKILSSVIMEILFCLFCQLLFSLFSMQVWQQRLFIHIYYEWRAIHSCALFITSVQKWWSRSFGAVILLSTNQSNLSTQ